MPKTERKRRKCKATEGGATVASSNGEDSNDDSVTGTEDERTPASGSITTPPRDDMQNVQQGDIMRAKLWLDGGADGSEETVRLAEKTQDGWIIEKTGATRR